MRSPYVSWWMIADRITQDVVVDDPLVELRCHRRVAFDEPADHVRRQGVDDVPPGAEFDEPSHPWQVLGLDLSGMGPQQIGAGVLELALGLGPARLGRRQHLVDGRVTEPADPLALRGATFGRLQPEIGEEVAHVPTHLGAPRRVGGGLERGPQLGETRIAHVLMSIEKRRWNSAM